MNCQEPQFKVLLADDEPSILNGLKNLIEWTDLNVSICATAQNGEQALRLILEFRPDVAIMDIRMPQKSGLEVIRECRERDIHTDFLILSGYDDFSYAKEAIRYGAKAYLLKPLNDEELRSELSRILSERLSSYRPDNNSNYTIDLDTTFFNDLIDNRIMDSAKIDALLLHSRINLKNTSCYCLIFLFDAQDSLLPFEEMIEKLDSSFRSVGHKIWEYDSQKLIGIFNNSDITSCESAAKCIDILRSAGFPVPIIGVGDTVAGLSECSYSYSRAQLALTYQLYNDHSEIFSYEMICTVPPHTTLADIDYLPLVQAIVRKDKDSIQKYCNSFINSLLYVAMPPPTYVFSLCYALFNLIGNEFSSFSHSDIQNTANAQELYQCTKLSQIRQWLIDSFCQLSEYVDAVYGYSQMEQAQEEVISSEEDDIIQTAKEYIHQNIQKQIHIEDIARQVHLSPSYFAIYFKNKTGQNLRDYLLSEKMDCAKKKLNDPRASINDIAYEVGYGDYRSFSRAFKKFCGMTPSEYQTKRRFNQP